MESANEDSQENTAEMKLEVTPLVDCDNIEIATTTNPVVTVEDPTLLYTETPNEPSIMMDSTHTPSTTDETSNVSLPRVTTTGITTSTPSTTTTTNPSVLEHAKMEVQQMVERNEFGDDTNSVSAIQTLFRENEAMKEKVTKLKTLLGRSAKAQRDTKVEIEQLQKKYDILKKENIKLQSRINQLSARPTHLDLLADFETNFDRALLSVVNQGNHTKLSHIQSGGQDTSGTTTTASSLDIYENGGLASGSNGGTGPGPGSNNSNNSMDRILMQEVSDAKKRIETLEQYNATLVSRSTQLENQYTNSKHTVTELAQKISHIELEKKMAQMEVDHMTKQLQYNQSSLNEMQLEIELLSKQSTIQQTAAHRRGVMEGDMNRTSNRSDPELIQHLQEQVKALEEWAIASNHAKTIANDRIRLLEQQLAAKQQSVGPTTSVITDVSSRSTGSTSDVHIGRSDGHSNNASMNDGNGEWVLDTRKASIVIGAGDVGIVLFELNPDQLKSVNSFTQRIALRWRFDILQGSDSDITFTILKGKCTTAAQRRNADTMIQNRMVKGGAGGEIDENAFSIHRSCTIVWSNQHSWIRPRTIKYILEAIVMND